MGKIDMSNENVYPKEVYTKVQMADLIVFGVYSVIKGGEVCTYERLVAECFRSFPSVFGFHRYPQWPDSLKFDRPLRSLRARGLIVGSVRDHFELTEFGKKEAERIEAILHGQAANVANRGVSKGRSVDDRLLEYVRASDVFKRFTSNPDEFSMSTPEFRELLRCTLESPERILKQNLEYYMKVAEAYGEEQVMRFLSFCEEKFVMNRCKNGKGNTNKLKDN